MYIVDTDILWAGAPTKAVPRAALSDWMDRNSGHLYVSVITIAELESGIAEARRVGARRKADRLATWLETVLHLYSARILPLDLSVSRILGALSDRARGDRLPGSPTWRSPPPHTPISIRC